MYLSLAVMQLFQRRTRYTAMKLANYQPIFAISSIIAQSWLVSEAVLQVK